MYIPTYTINSRRSDLMNERLPVFEPDSSPSASPTTMFPPPSMRLPSRRAGSMGEGLNMEMLIKKTLEEDEDDSPIVERLAERIARGRRVTGRPQPLKRHETT